MQLGFIEAAPVPRRMRLALHGQLAEAPRVRHSHDGSTHVAVRLLAPEGELQLYAVCHMPPHLRDEAERFAYSLQPGHVVMVVGGGLSLGEFHGAQLLELRECTSISPIDIQP